MEALTELAHHPDRDRYNLPARIDDPECLGAPDCVFLPVYAVRSVQAGHRVRLFVYTQVGSEADPDLTELCERTPEIGSVVEMEEVSARPGFRDKAGKWLEGRGISRYELTELDGGAWRAVVPASSFGGNTGLSLSKVGSFTLLHRDILHIWCADEQVRYQALLERADAYLGAWGRLNRNNVQAPRHPASPPARPRPAGAARPAAHGHQRREERPRRATPRSNLTGPSARGSATSMRRKS